VLAVIRNDANAAGECFLSVAQIAERAKVGRTKARAAIKLAESYGIITIVEASGGRRVIVHRRAALTHSVSETLSDARSSNQNELGPRALGSLSAEHDFLLHS
jgi:DNA-binding FadR family transcriptional regulator